MEGDFGVVNCKSCGATYLVDFDGQLVVNQESEISDFQFQNQVELEASDYDNERIENLISDEQPISNQDYQSYEPQQIDSLPQEFELSPLEETPEELIKEPIEVSTVQPTLEPLDETLEEPKEEFRESIEDSEEEMMDDSHPEEMQMEASNLLEMQMEDESPNNSEEGSQLQSVESIKVTWSEPLQEDVPDSNNDFQNSPSPIPIHSGVKPATTAAKFSASPSLSDKKQHNEKRLSTTESIMSEVVSFGNSPKSNANSGWYLYNLTIRGMDSQDIKTRVLQTFSDPRLKLNPKNLYNSIQSGAVTVNELNPLKVFVLVNALKSLPIEIYWEQHELTE